MVAVLLTKYTGDPDAPVASIKANREKCLTARGIGIGSWGMSQFAAERMGLKVAWRPDGWPDRHRHNVAIGPHRPSMSVGRGTIAPWQKH